MQNFLLSILLIAVLTAIGLLFLVYKKLSVKKDDSEDKNLFIMLQNQMQNMSRVFDEKMSETHRTINNTQQDISKTLQEQFGQSTKLIQGIHNQSNQLISSVTEKLTSLDKTNQQVIGFSQQLSNLEKVLKSQKQRGNLGEAGLKLVLENILPPTAFQMQYHFKDGDIVDAAIFTKDGVIPVDAKFSLENYEKLVNENDDTVRASLEKDFKNDLKKRIEETSKYIKPKEGTMDFAFMFIPSEAIYYDLLINEVGAVKVNTRDLIDFAFNQKRVIIVSPTTFAAYLQTVLQGLRALRIEESAKSIRKNVEMLGKHIQSYEEFMKKLGSSLGTTVNHYNTAYKELGKVDKDIMKITENSGNPIEPMNLDRPKEEGETD